MKTLKMILCVTIGIIACMMVSCSSSQNMGGRPSKDAETLQLSGIETVDELSEDGKKIEPVPYKWFLGVGEADNERTAIEFAQREAYATISLVLNDAMQSVAERGTVANNGKTQEALTSYWKQFSSSLQKACAPFGAAQLFYDEGKGMYKVRAKVGLRGDRFNQLLKSAGAFKPEGLSGEELENFINVNKAIIGAAKSGL